jgi:DNA (cytosine-5)-methyltransferase 1
LASSQQTPGSMHSVTLAQAVIRPDLLPTPRAGDRAPAQSEIDNNDPKKRLEVAVALLPTPNTMEHREIKTPEQIAELKLRSPGGYRNLRETVVNELLPTTTARDHKDGQTKHYRDGKLQTDTISRAVNELTKTWGKFAPAIERWEQIIGRPAPAPTNPDGKENKHRLSSRFTEWLMGLPEGWITNVGLTRAEELKACGNGVLPQQAKLALAILLDGVEW